MLTAPRVGGIFSPQRTSLKLDPHGYSPSVLAKIVHAGAVLPSFELAAKTLRLLADLSVSGRHVGRLTETIGAELVATRDEQAEAHRTRQLQVQVPNSPGVVAVEVDGGRHQRRAEGRGCGARDPQWREDKVACLVTLASGTRDTDPQPEPPECFLDRKRVGRLTQCSIASEPEISDKSVEPTSIPQPDPIHWQPQRLVRTCVATARESEQFGYLVAAEAKARNFEAANQLETPGAAAGFVFNLFQALSAKFSGTELNLLKPVVAQFANTPVEMSAGMGSNGSGALIRACLKILTLTEGDEAKAWSLVCHYNATRCQPPWDTETDTGPDSLRRKFNVALGFWTPR